MLFLLAILVDGWPKQWNNIHDHACG
uniref:Uncharacterized protein n=1 Tax=Physcomitrium patens TaxID=3218 RepID=A0A2K1LA46_PHYPA|nr:hypothetical protein PHYPA_001316 [Physcomitrium patens]